MCTQAGRGWSVRMRARRLALPTARSAIWISVIANIAENAISKTFSFMERAVI